MKPIVRQTKSVDLVALELVYARAFPDEDLVPVLRALFANQEIAHISAERPVEVGDGVIGHVAMTPCRVGTVQGLELLGPLAVDPASHRQGTGTKLVQSALAAATARGAAIALVLGDPGYYARFGFTQETEIRPPHPIPENWAPAWQSLRLRAAAAMAGKLCVPAPWDNPDYWC